MTSLADRAREAAADATNAPRLAPALLPAKFLGRVIGGNGWFVEQDRALRAIESAVNNAVAALLGHAEAELAERDEELARLRSELDLASFANTTNEETIARLQADLDAARKGGA